jgi:cytoskeletal protein CcmA (bactofilin family)
MKIIGMGNKKAQETIIKGDLVLEKDMSYPGNLVVEGSVSGTCGSRFNLEVNGDLRVSGNVSVRKLTATGSIHSDANISARSISALDISACSISANSVRARDITTCKVRSYSVTAHSILQNPECGHAENAKEQLFISLKRNPILY